MPFLLKSKYRCLVLITRLFEYDSYDMFLLSRLKTCMFYVYQIYMKDMFCLLKSTCPVRDDWFYDFVSKKPLSIFLFFFEIFGKLSIWYKRNILMHWNCIIDYMICFVLIQKRIFDFIQQNL